MTPNEAHTIIDHCLAYAAKGLEIFPVNWRTKHPLVENGMKDATTNPTTITKWWRTWPDASIACRIPEGVVVLDIDPRHNGHQTWTELENHFGTLTTTRWHASGRGDGGRHLWYRHPTGKLRTKKLDEWAKTNGVGHQAGKRSWSAGIDILHHNHRYSILPPSLHGETSTPYTWGAEGPIPDLPAPLAALIVADDTPPEPLRIVQDPTSIADWYTNNHSWLDILPREGWQLVDGDGDSDGSRWRHPNATAEHSATTRHGCLFVYTPNTDFPVTENSDPKGITRFRAYTTLNHDGDGKSAARAAYELRDGPPPTRTQTPTIETDIEEEDEAGETLADRIQNKLITATQLRDIPPPQPLIDGLIDLDSLVFLFGPSGHYKTFLAMDWALSVATGSWWAGREVTQSTVLYVAGEGLGGLWARVEAWMAHQKIYTPPDRFMILPEAINLTDIVNAYAIGEVAARIGAQFVILDTLARMAVGADESSSRDMGVLIDQADIIRRSTGATVLPVHHAGKDITQGMRGSSALFAAADTVISCSAEDNNVTVEITKQKNRAHGNPLNLRAHPIASSIVLIQGGYTPSDDMPESVSRTLQALVAIAVDNGITTGEWEESAGFSRKTFYRHRSDLLRLGTVENIGTDKMPRYRPTPPNKGEQMSVASNTHSVELADSTYSTTPPTDSTSGGVQTHVRYTASEQGKEAPGGVGGVEVESPNSTKGEQVEPETPPYGGVLLATRPQNDTPNPHPIKATNGNQPTQQPAAPVVVVDLSGFFDDDDPTPRETR